MNEVVTLVFDELPPGLNGRKGLLRMHWKLRQQLNQRWYWLVLNALNGKRPDAFSETRPCNVRATRHDCRPMDWDNFGASLKPVLDGLIKCGVLEDDGPGVVRSLTLHQVHVQHKNASRLVLQIIPETKEARNDDKRQGEGEPNRL